MGLISDCLNFTSQLHNILKTFIIEYETTYVDAA